MTRRPNRQPLQAPYQLASSDFATAPIERHPDGVFGAYSAISPPRAAYALSNVFSTLSLGHDRVGHSRGLVLTPGASATPQVPNSRTLPPAGEEPSHLPSSFSSVHPGVDMQTLLARSDHPPANFYFNTGCAPHSSRALHGIQRLKSRTSTVLVPLHKSTPPQINPSTRKPCHSCPCLSLPLLPWHFVLDAGMAMRSSVAWIPNLQSGIRLVLRLGPIRRLERCL
ncbi:hypothetical protein BCR34DRAFT_317416 [Clohesyomyces aquaticus]|uniref:Uncharacterized protein n=1 Tax=Clohesyomyces aquaticus TaxID=1231657 RepID=A0A1Y1ZNE9_9PLEO|nr:hypothetical protein BCR34DRAFT_317416 [Clohesyomyces aquaticus]